MKIKIHAHTNSLNNTYINSYTYINTEENGNDEMKFPFPTLTKGNRLDTLKHHL